MHLWALWILGSVLSLMVAVISILIIVMVIAIERERQAKNSNKLDKNVYPFGIVASVVMFGLVLLGFVTSTPFEVAGSGIVALLWATGTGVFFIVSFCLSPILTKWVDRDKGKYPRNNGKIWRR